MSLALPTEFWNLNEASGNATGAIASQTLTDNNSVGTAAGKVGTARSFLIASAQRLSRASETLLQTGDIDFYAGIWVYFDALPAVDSILVEKWGTASENEWSLNYLAGTGFAFVVSSSGVDIVASPRTTVASTGQWYFVEGWHDSVANTVNCRVNQGTTVSTSHSGGVRAGASPLSFGGRSDGTFYLSGRLDLAIFEKSNISANGSFLYNGANGMAWPWALPDVGAITASGVAPASRLQETLSAGAAALTGIAASLILSVGMPVGAEAYSGIAPKLQTIVTTQAGGVTASGVSPGLQLQVPIGTGSESYSGVAPTFQYGVGPSPGTEVYSGVSPGLREDHLIPVGSVAISGVTVIPGEQITIDAGSASLTGIVAAIQILIGVPVGSTVYSGVLPGSVIGPFAYPDAGAEAYTGIAPAILAQIQVPPGSLLMGGVAEVIQEIIAVPVGSAVISGQAPSPQYFVYPDVGSEVYSGVAPSNRQSYGVGVGSEAFSGVAPALQTTIGVPVGGLTASGVAPFFQAYLNQSAGAESYAGVQPSVRIQVAIPVGAVTTTGYPVVSEQSLTIRSAAEVYTGTVPATQFAIGVPSGGLTFVVYTTITPSTGTETYTGRAVTLVVPTAAAVGRPRHLLHPRMHSMLQDHWPSRCTIQLVVNAISDSRQLVPIGGSDVTGLVNLKCRMGPLIELRPTDNENRSQRVFEVTQRRQCKLDGYYPSIVPNTHRAIVDGVNYLVRGNESDSEHFSSRLTLEVVNPHG